MSAWVSRERRDKSGKRSFERLSPGVRGVKDADRFVVFWYDPDRRQKQERIKRRGKPGKEVRAMLPEHWDDVSLDKGHLLVRHGETKAKRDDRIPLHPVAVAHLKRIQDIGLSVFDWPFGKRALLDQWHAIQRKAEIDLPCHERHECTDTCHVYGFHALKKACGTLNAARLPEAALNAFMRHASRETTRKYYQNAERIAGGVVGDMWVPDVAVNG